LVGLRLQFLLKLLERVALLGASRARRFKAVEQVFDAGQRNASTSASVGIYGRR